MTAEIIDLNRARVIRAIAARVDTRFVDSPAAGALASIKALDVALARLETAMRKRSAPAAYVIVDEDVPCSVRDYLPPVRS